MNRDTGVLHASGVTDKGPIRAINEDCFAIDDRLRLCVVADGMGGHNAGEVAARLGVETVLAFFRDSKQAGGEWPFGFEPSLSTESNRLRTAIHLANEQILERAGAAPEYSGMGTTIVAALVCGGRLSVAHAGDSRLYLYGVRYVSDAGPTSFLRRLTKDDSFGPNVLTNAVGTSSRTEVHVVEEMLGGGETIALTTDGVHGLLDDRQIEAVLSYAWRSEDAAATLVRDALARGSRDNCTAVVAQYVAEIR